MERKTCSQCGIKKELSEYHKDRGYLRSNCKECHNNKKKTHYKKNRDHYIEKMREYDSSSEAKEKRRLRHASRMSKDPIYKLQRNFRGRLSKVVSGKCRSDTSLEILGCSWEELKSHIEKQWQEGMSWNNYGLHGWHVDHIIPLSSAESVDQLLELCHYTNLQPLWAEDNISKGASISR